MRKLWILFALVAAYGSLYPFNFRRVTLDGGVLAAFLSTYNTPSGSGDILGNVALFVPFGLFGILAVQRQSPGVQRLLWVCLAGVLLALALQIAQLYLPSRDGNLTDVFWNLIGIVAGAAFGIPVHRLLLRFSGRGDGVQAAPLLLIAAWLFYRLLPFVPSIDWALIKESLKPLLMEPQLDAVAAARNAVAWIAVAYLLRAIRQPARYDLVLPAMIPIVMGLEVLIVANYVTLSNVVGATIALVAWFGVLRGLRRPEILLAALMLCTLAAAGLEPFILRASPASFSWLPFRGFLGGSMYFNVHSAAEKIFWYGTVTLLLWRAQVRFGLSLVLASSFVFLIELAQTRFMSHTPEITDPILVLAAAFVLRALERMNNTDRARGGAAAAGSFDELERPLMPREVRLYPDQIAFLGELSATMNVNISRATRKIIDDMFADHGDSLPVVLAKAMRRPGPGQSAPRRATAHEAFLDHDALSSTSLWLRRDQISKLDDLAKRANVSLSRIMRQLIRRFMRDLIRDE